MKERPDELHTRSQRQAAAAVATYRWITTLPADRPIDADLIRLGAIGFEKLEQNRYRVFVRLEWPTGITETEFFAKVKAMPKAKAHGFLD